MGRWWMIDKSAQIGTRGLKKSDDMGVASLEGKCEMNTAIISTPTDPDRTMILLKHKTKWSISMIEHHEMIGTIDPVATKGAAAMATRCGAAEEAEIVTKNGIG